MRRLRDDVKGMWESILEGVGIDKKYLKNVQGPCPICGGNDRFRFDNKEHGMWYCNKCKAGDGFSLIQGVFDVSFKDAAGMVEEVLGQAREDSRSSKRRTSEETIAYCHQIWKDAKRIEVGDPVDLYLRGRGLGLTHYPGVMRYHPGLEFYESKKLVGCYPAMVCAVQGRDGKVVGLHRTYLSRAGASYRKVERKAIGATEGVIRLARVESGCLGVAEGIETALAAHAIFEVPVWSTISAGGMERLQLPSTCTKLVIFGDNDESFTGQAAAYKLAKAAREAAHKDGREIEVEVHIPEETGHDWADEYLDNGAVPGGVREGDNVLPLVSRGAGSGEGVRAA